LERVIDAINRVDGIAGDTLNLAYSAGNFFGGLGRLFGQGYFVGDWLSNIQR